MSYEVRPPSVGAAVGAGLGSGISDQIPREVERYRLSSGLKRFSDQSQNLNPMQAMAQLAGIPGITPQMIQSFGDLARMQQKGLAYGRLAEGDQGQSQDGMGDPSEEALMDAQSNVIPKRLTRNRRGIEQPTEERPQIQERNPLDPSMRSRPPWSPQKRAAEIDKLIKGGLLFEDAEREASDRERREREIPEVNKKNYQELEDIKENIRNELTRKIESNTQKQGEDIYKDVIGENLIRAEREIAKELRQNPEATVDDLTEDWSKKILDTAKAKNQYKKLVNTMGIESLWKGDKYLKDLLQYGKIMKESGNSEEYFNLLREDGFSPQMAGYAAYQPSTKIKSFLSSIKPSRSYSGPHKYRKMANDVLDNLDPEEDSLLGITLSLRRKDPYFNQKAFFDEIREQEERIKSNPRLDREIAEGRSDTWRNWKDFLVMPLRGE